LIDYLDRDSNQDRSHPKRTPLTSNIVKWQKSEANQNIFNLVFLLGRVRYPRKSKDRIYHLFSISLKNYKNENTLSLVTSYSILIWIKD
jgi:hypothetical protein